MTKKIDSIFKVQNITQLNNFLKEGGDINETNWRGETALYFEEFINNYELLKGVLEAGISTTHSIPGLSSPVFQATEYECMELLIQYQFDINVKDEEGCPLGHYFASNENLLSLLLINHYDINLTDEQGENILFRDDLESEVGFLAINAGIDILQRNENNESALFHVDSHLIAKELIARGLSVNDLNNENSTPLMINTQSECCRVFIQEGANVHHINDNGDNALTVKNYYGINKVKLLVEAGVDINHCNSNHENISFLKKDKDILKFAIENGLDIECRNKQGKNVLEETISIEIAEILVNSGIHIDENTNKYAEPIREYIVQELSKKQREILTKTVEIKSDLKPSPRI